MLGSFFTLFYQYNVIGKALKVVWIHGTLEISAIIIAGCAGFILGNSYIFPKTHTRMHSFVKGGKDGLKVVIGLIPIFIMAGFLESFITRYTEMPLALSLTIIIISFAFIVGYFIVLPLYFKKKYKIHHD
ncbi:MAG: rane protein, partial [Bacteroidetes bacterium]|nr:rane protein [Bacteroidota bacterium]